MKLDTKEFELPDTIFVRDIETGVFQSIVLQCLSNVNGITLVSEGKSLLNLESEGSKGILVEQDPRSHSISVKVEVSIAYGIPIPDKAEEIQTLISEEVTKLTGLHVGMVHVVFKNVYFAGKIDEKRESVSESDYTDEF